MRRRASGFCYAERSDATPSVEHRHRNGQRQNIASNTLSPTPELHSQRRPPLSKAESNNIHDFHSGVKLLVSAQEVRPHLNQEGILQPFTTHGGHATPAPCCNQGQRAKGGKNTERERNQAQSALEDDPWQPHGGSIHARAHTPTHCAQSS